MRKLVYDIAMSLDGFIARADGSVDGLLAEGDHVTDFMNRLGAYDTVLMGRATYEWGYRFGLTPGALAYPHMQHHVFSRTLRFDDSPVHVVSDDEIGAVERLKQQDGGDIYLCGGGAFAGFLLDNRLVDQVVVKLSPVLLGGGVRLFGASRAAVELTTVESKRYDNGVLLLRYDVSYTGATPRRRTLAEVLAG